MINLTPKQLRQAADIKERLESLQSQLNAILGGEVPTPLRATAAPQRRGGISAAGLANIRAAQKARWAKVRGGVPKRRLSAQGLANIRAGVRKRMAAQAKAPKQKRVMTPAWRAALARAWAARRAQAAKSKA